MEEELKQFVDLYWEVYAATDHHPTPLEEARVINIARELRAKWQPQPVPE